MYRSGGESPAPDLDMSIEESSVWSQANNIGAILLLVVLGFVCGYYA